MHNVSEGVDNDLIKRDEYRHLDKEGQAAAKGTVMLLLVHLLNLHGDLLLCSLIVASRVLFADRHFLGAESSLLNGVFVLLDADREKAYLKYQGKHKQGNEVVARSEIENAEEISYPT
jgi:hypothetical protein